MTKREYCETHKACAYYYGLNGLECHGIEYGIDDYMYLVSGAWCGVKSFHRVKIRYTSGGNPFVIVHGYRCPLDEFVRM